MGTQIDFYITGVSYNSDETEIKSVEVRLRLEPITGMKEVSSDVRRVSRGFIYDLLRTEKIVFYTATYNSEKNTYQRGAEVIIYGKKYITTAGNKKEKDNLENLPQF